MFVWVQAEEKINEKDSNKIKKDKDKEKKKKNKKKNRKRLSSTSSKDGRSDRLIKQASSEYGVSCVVFGSTWC